MARAGEKKKRLADIFDDWFHAALKDGRLPVLMVLAIQDDDSEGYTVHHASGAINDETALLLLDEVRHTLAEKIKAKEQPIGRERHK